MKSWIKAFGTDKSHKVIAPNNEVGLLLYFKIFRGQSSAPFRTIAAPFGVQDALRISKGGTRAVKAYHESRTAL